ncbi:hypothetical protein AB1N83_010942 [Pleurotus pulmonarius]
MNLNDQSATFDTAPAVKLRSRVAPHPWRRPLQVSVLEPQVPTALILPVPTLMPLRHVTDVEPVWVPFWNRNAVMMAKQASNHQSPRP